MRSVGVVPAPATWHGGGAWQVPAHRQGQRHSLAGLGRRYQRGGSVGRKVLRRKPVIFRKVAGTAESAPDEFGQLRLGGIGSVIAKEIEKRTGFETRVTVLGHIQRGGTPTAFDRILAGRFGVAAMGLAMEEDFGKMVALQANRVVSLPLEVAAGKRRTVPDEFYNAAKVFFG